MSGYENGSADGRTPMGDIADATGLPLPLQCGSRCSHSVFFGDEYVTVQASVRVYLQRGMLRTSHRAITRSLSDRTTTGRIYRPWRPHTNPTLVREPGRPVNYLVEIFPVGHVLRKGHELVVKVHVPPLDDNDYMYIQKTLRGRNTLHIDPKHPSRILVPLIPLREVRNLRPSPPLCSYEQMRCVSPG